MTKQNSTGKVHAVGINHIALEVGDIDEALDFYAQIFEFETQSRNERAAFIYFGDQFINFAKYTDRKPDAERHVGIAVDDYDLAKQTIIDLGIEILPGPFLDFLDPWGNRIEITTYVDIQYTKADHILRGMGLEHLKKSPSALSELEEKGMAPDG